MLKLVCGDNPATALLACNALRFNRRALHIESESAEADSFSSKNAWSGLLDPCAKAQGSSRPAFLRLGKRPVPPRDVVVPTQ